jgi:IS30 family transposase
LKRKGYSFADIGKAMDRAKSSVWNEFCRNKVKGRYVPKKAHHKAYVRRKQSKYQGKKIVHDHALKKNVDELLRQGLSPEIVAGRVRRQLTHLSPIGRSRPTAICSRRNARLGGGAKRNPSKAGHSSKSARNT